MVYIIQIGEPFGNVMTKMTKGELLLKGMGEVLTTTWVISKVETCVVKGYGRLGMSKQFNWGQDDRRLMV